MRAFWTKGYEATSLADLMSATGLHKGSLYQAFGDKHTLFVLALKRYLDDMRRQKNEIVEAAETPFTGIRKVMHCMLDIADADSVCPRGCLAINSLVELAPHDEQVQQVLGNHLKGMRSSLEEAIGAAQSSGEISTKHSPELFAALLITFMDGLAVMLKGSMDKPTAHRLMDAQLEALA